MKAIHIINETIYENRETIAESICLSHPELFYSNNYKSILVPLYDTDNYDKLFQLIEVTLQLTQIHVFSRIFFAVSGRNNYHIILSRFKHISGIFKAQRLPQLEKILSFMDITKIYHPFDPELKSLHKTDIPTMHTINVYHEDLAKAINFVGKTKNLLLINCNNRSKIIREHHKIKTPYILFTKEYIPYIKAKQVTYNGYIYKNESSHYRRKFFVYNPNIIIGLALGLMFQHQYTRLDKTNNLFDYLYYYSNH